MSKKEGPDKSRSRSEAIIQEFRNEVQSSSGDISIELDKWRNELISQIKTVVQQTAVQQKYKISDRDAEEEAVKIYRDLKNTLKNSPYQSTFDRLKSESEIVEKLEHAEILKKSTRKMINPWNEIKKSLENKLLKEPEGSTKSSKDKISLEEKRSYLKKK